MRVKTKHDAIVCIAQAYKPHNKSLQWAKEQLERSMQNTDVLEDQWTEELFEELLKWEFDIPSHSPN